MSKRLLALKRAEEEVNAAREQENEEGDPKKAAEHYITAAEIVTVVLHNIHCESNAERAYIHFRCHEKIQDYAARADLLLGIVEDEIKFGEKASSAQQQQPPTQHCDPMKMTNDPDNDGKDTFDKLYAAFLEDSKEEE